MDLGWKSAPAFVALGLLSLFGSGCQQDGGLSTAPSTSQSSSHTAGKADLALAARGSTNGAASQMPAYFEGELFTVNMMQLPDNGGASITAENQSLNEIYASNDLDEEQDFVPVINAIQGEGFNPLWHQNLIVFNPGFTPHQFVSEGAIKAAAEGPNPEISIVVTDEVYRCSVVGRKS